MFATTHDVTPNRLDELTRKFMASKRAWDDARYARDRAGIEFAYQEALRILEEDGPGMLSVSALLKVCARARKGKS